MNQNLGMTRQMMVNEMVQARIRKDGGELVKVEIWHKNGARGEIITDPHTAAQIAFDVKFNGGRAEITRHQ